MSEHKNQVIFGLPCSSKKNAKAACALRILDLLIITNEFNCLDQCDKKSNKLKKKGSSFADDVDYGVEFKELNPISDKCKDTTTAQAIRERAFTLYNSGFLKDIIINSSTKVYLETHGNSISLLNAHCGHNCQPEYFNFIIPNESKM